MPAPRTPYVLSGQRAFVTGGSRGIGRSIALGLASCGAHVAVNYREAAAAAADVVRAISELGRTGVAVRADVRDHGAIAAMLDDVERAIGPIDILVNNAGVLNRTPFLEISLEEWTWVLQTNLHAPFMIGQAVARRMVERGAGGRIVNIASTSSKLAAPNLSHYCVSKAGVSMLTRSMALELARYGIQVNEVNPGLIESDMTRGYLDRDHNRETRLSRIPLQRVGDPGDIVGAVLFLASHDASLMTGASVYVDGGVTIW